VRKSVILLLFLVFPLISCSGEPVKIVKVPTKYSSYSDQWAKVQGFEKDGKPRSAMKVLEKIVERAKKDKNSPQVVKGLINLTKNVMSIGEVKFADQIKILMKASDGADIVTKAVLDSMLAEIFWTYYQSNRYRFMERSETTKVQSDDISTWDLKTIIKKVKDLHLSALKNADVLKKFKIELYDEILIKGQKPRKLRPTLYDFLAHRALQFFMYSDVKLTEIAEPFKMMSGDYFGSAEKFISMHQKFDSQDSLQAQALKIFSDVTLSHIKDKNRDALVDVELLRLQYVSANIVVDKKSDLYFNALQKLEKKYSKSGMVGLIRYNLAVWYRDNSYVTNFEHPQKDEKKWYLKKAALICEAVIKKEVSSEAGDKCRVLVSNLSSKQLSLQAEDVNTIEKPFRLFTSFKNVKDLYFKAVKLDKDMFMDIKRNNYRSDEVIKKLTKAKPSQKWKVTLPDDGDYRNHSTEIKVPGLKKGFYAIFAQTKENLSFKDISKKGNAAFYTVTTVSNLSVISSFSKKGAKLFVADRETGKPIKGARVKAYYSEYSNWKSKYVTRKLGRGKTNSDGITEISSGSKRNYRSFVTVEKNGEMIYSELHFSYRYRKRAGITTYLFTDRAIYRPGQKIFFKGIMVNFDKNRKPKIVPNRKTRVRFYDVNSQQISKLNLKTDKFGSFHGSFTSPEGTLNGAMRIQNEFGTKYVSVEEYKRPKFETEILPTEKSFKLGDSVEVKGTAKSYSGFPLSNAKVSWTVTRSTYFPYTYWGYGYGNYSTGGVVMSNGEAVTDNEGGYKINFKAKPDLTIPEMYSPAFTYSVYADVTDINGETHSASRIIRVGYTALVLSENISGNLNVGEELKFNVSSTNLDGQKVKAKGTYEIVKLKQPQTLFRKRLWSKPDKHMLKKDEYELLFPHDIYASEDSFYKWGEEKALVKGKFDTKTDKKISVDCHEWKEGKYLIRMTSKDRYGRKVDYKKYFDVFKPESGKTDDRTMSRIFAIKNTVEPGNDAEIYIGSAAKDVVSLVYIHRKNKKPEKIRLNLDGQKNIVQIPVKESDRGNLAYTVVFQKYGRSYSQYGVITVPWTNKQLKIETMTFRDKLTPGTKEEFRLKITGPKAEKAAAQMMALMYDSSLDSFVQHSLWFNVAPYNTFQVRWIENTTHRVTYSMQYAPNWFSWYYGQNYNYDVFNWNGFPRNGYYSFKGRGRDRYTMNRTRNPMSVVPETVAFGDDDEVMEKESSGSGSLRGGSAMPAKRNQAKRKSVEMDKSIVTKTMGLLQDQTVAKPQIRKNFQETAFFMPVLKTNSKGEIIIAFEVPDSLTKWHFMGLAHTKDLKIGQISKYLTTVKELMVTPNVPRFLREGDTVILSTKISNMSEKKMTGQVELKLFDSLTMKAIDKDYGNEGALKKFSVKANGNTSVDWKVKVPMMAGTLTWRIVASSGKLSDGEENALPVLSNRMLVTESLPLPINGKETKDFKFKKLIESGSSKTISNHKLTLEFTSNPTWYAVQAIPYLVEYPYECAEQIFSRLYANSLSMHIVKKNPTIKKVFDKWRGTDAMLSNLHKNQELKSVLLKETPWVLDSQNEEVNKKRLANFFETKRMQRGLDRASRKLKRMQAYNGGWPWFPGFPESWFISQHIVSGFGKLKNMKVKVDASVTQMSQKGVHYIDGKSRERYEYLKTHKIDLNRKNIGYMEIHYLYARSFFKNVKMRPANKKAFNYWLGQAEKYWLGETPYMNAMAAVALFRHGQKKIAKKIVESLKERAIYNEELGMYYKENMGGYYWYQFPIETQATIIEAFEEISGDRKIVNQLKQWLLKMKQVQGWKTTKATVDAVYALLMRGDNWLKNSKDAMIKVGGVKVEPKKLGAKVEAGTGHFKVAWRKEKVKPEMGKVTVENPNSNPAWGALYWQYFEDLDKITPHKTPLALEKDIFLEVKTATGVKLEKVTQKTKLAPGDRLKIRVVLRTDRDMEYIHMRDMRPAGTEPENVISRHKYQDGLWYYESTKDTSTDFFMERLNKGTYVFEYPLVVNLRGDFSAGITTIQCMYAPEFTSHSKGIRVEVK